jgi:hypothetical protein
LIEENPTWGSNRIVGALANLGHTLSDATVDNVRQRNGFDPAPLRGKNNSWRRFLRSHWDTLIAADFFTTEVLSWRGLVTYYTLFVIELRSRSVHNCGTTVSLDTAWMAEHTPQTMVPINAKDGSPTIGAFWRKLKEHRISNPRRSAATPNISES